MSHDRNLKNVLIVFLYIKLLNVSLLSRLSRHFLLSSETFGANPM